MVQNYYSELYTNKFIPGCSYIILDSCVSLYFYNNYDAELLVDSYDNPGDNVYLHVSDADNIKEANDIIFNGVVELDCETTNVGHITCKYLYVHNLCDLANVSALFIEAGENAEFILGQNLSLLGFIGETVVTSYCPNLIIRSPNNNYGCGNIENEAIIEIIWRNYGMYTEHRFMLKCSRHFPMTELIKGNVLYKCADFIIYGPYFSFCSFKKKSLFAALLPVLSMEYDNAPLLKNANFIC